MKHVRSSRRGMFFRESRDSLRRVARGSLCRPQGILHQLSIAAGRAGSLASVLLAIAVYETVFALPSYGAELAGARIEERLTPEIIDSLSTPYQHREPRDFWMNRRVFLKPSCNNVIEDPDYVVRERYWTLDASAVGTVIEVTPVEGKQMLLVRFDSRDGWTEHGLEKRGGVAVQQEGKSTTVRRIEGERLFDDDECGVIEEQTDDVTIVRCPSGICTLPVPRVGDWVVRGPDWRGFADGGDRRFGPISGGRESFRGEVTEVIDSDNLIDVKWKVTGRVSACRFDHSGFFEIEVIPSDAPPKRRRNGDTEDEQEPSPEPESVPE